MIRNNTGVTKGYVTALPTKALPKIFEIENITSSRASYNLETPFFASHIGSLHR